MLGSPSTVMDRIAATPAIMTIAMISRVVLLR